LFLKAYIPTKILLFVVFISNLAACSAYNSGSEKIQNESDLKTLSGSFALAQQVDPPPIIQSIQLYPQGNELAPPIINLGEPRRLILEFDYLDAGVQQFKVTVSHRNKNWGESPIGPTIYLDSFFETFFGDGRKSFVQKPTYYHYTFSFPNQQLSITKSGNYLLSVFDNDSNTLLFRIPFFVSENTGTLSTRIETLFAQRNDSRSLAQPFSEYRFPAFVQQPQFDLSFMYVQNQFWGRTRESTIFDTATPGIVNFHLARDKSFIDDFEFILLDIRSFRPDGQEIIEFQPAEEPPVITLRRDIQRFDSRPSRFPGPKLGLPDDDLQAEYGIIKFSLQPAIEISPDEQMYLVGDFNNWMIDPRYRMQFDSTRSLWEGKALIKQGVYAYKYVLLEDYIINDLALDRTLIEPRQEYITFVYYNDPQRNFDRLLKVDVLPAR